MFYYRLKWSTISIYLLTNWQVISKIQGPQCVCYGVYRWFDATSGGYGGVWSCGTNHVPAPRHQPGVGEPG